MTSTHLGLDLGGTNIKVAVLERSGDALEVVATDSIETEAAGGPEDVTANLVDLGLAGVSEHSASTVGLGVPGHFDQDSGRIVIFPNLPGEWAGFPLRDRVETALGVETLIVNDARAFTLAEGLLGAGKGCGTLACITLGTGVGGGLMIDGHLHKGAFGVAGEVGHQTIVPDGPVCGCGNRGCLEALVKADVLAANAGRSSARSVFDGVRNGDERCIAAVKQMAEYLGIGLANIVTVFGPDRIVIGGGIAEAGDMIIGPITAAVRSRATLIPDDDIDIVPAEFGRFSGAVGAGLAGALRI